MNEDWRDEALCATSDPEAWFPEQGGPGTKALRICRACPVRIACLTYALDRPELLGIWGGATTKGRIDLRRRRVA